MSGQMILNVVCPFLGTIAFAVLFQVPRRYYFSCGMTGMLGFLMYYTATQWMTVAVASFLGALVVVLLSRILAVWKKCPITIFLISGIFPLVPGTGVYYTAYYLVTDQLALAAEKGIESLKIGFAIVLGIIFIVSIPRQFFKLEYWKQKRFGQG